MATIGGHQGLLTITGLFSTLDTEITSFTLTTADVVFEDTIFTGSAAVQSVKRGLPRWSGHASGLLPQGQQFPISSITPGRANSTLVLQTETGKTYTGPAQIYSIQPSVTIQGGAPLNRLEFDFTFNNEPTVA